MFLYSIKDLEKLTGIKAHTIRIWEKRYGIVSPQRTSTNIRYYTEMDLKKLLNVALLVKNGIKISQLAGCSCDDLNDKIVDIFYKTNGKDTLIDQLVLAMSELDDKRFNSTISSSILNKGFESTIVDLIFPFLERLGLLWQTGNINTAQERFVLSILRQKILVALDSMHWNPALNTKLFMMFLPMNELHEIELLFYRYIIRKHGHKVIYLGQSIPFDDVVEIANVKNVDFLFFTANSPMTNPDFDTYTLRLSKKYPDKKILISGLQIRQTTRNTPLNVLKINSMEDLKDILSSLE